MRFSPAWVAYFMSGRGLMGSKGSEYVVGPFDRKKEEIYT